VRGENHSMQPAGGRLLADGSTAATP